MISKRKSKNWGLYSGFLGLIFSFCALFLSAAILQAEDKPVTVSVKTEPGDSEKSLLLKVTFKIAAGWHIYGQEVGETGLPTKIEIEDSNQFTLSDWQWPETKTIKDEDGVPSMKIYKDEAIVLTTVTLKDRSVVTKLNAHISWLSCSESLCIPENRDFELSLKL